MRGEVQSHPALRGALLANTGHHTFVLTGWLSCGPVVGSLEPVPSPPPTQRPLPWAVCGGHGDGCPDTPPKGRACCPAVVSPRDSHRELSPFQRQVHRWLMEARA